jgi:imidazolonepropionase
VDASKGPCLVTGIAELYTPHERVEDAAFVVDGGRFGWVGRSAEAPPEAHALPRVDLGGRGVLPGLVDSHTHLVWDGSRVAEYALRSQGASYEALLASGGGIHATVRATRSAGDERLHGLARRRAAAFLRGGVTTLEVKSGYGLTTEEELRQLAVARRLGDEGPQRLTTTLLAHVPDPEVDRAYHVDRLVAETVPEAAARGLADAVDVFVDRGAFTLDEARRVLEAGLAAGLQVKAHAEQLTRTGAARLVAELGGVSADHLERATDEDLAALAAAGVVATVLPGAAAVLGAGLPAPERFRAAGVKVAVASDHNPGSSPLFGLLPALQLAVAVYGFTVDETLVGATAHAADALRLPDVGRIRPGAHADFVVADGPEALLPLYGWGEPLVHEVVIGGVTAWRRGG